MWMGELGGGGVDLSMARQIMIFFQAKSGLYRPVKLSDWSILVM